MKKAFMFALALGFIVSASACKEDAVLEQTELYQVAGEIHSLDIKINAASLIIEHADDFFVESNLKYLSVTENSGVLTITDEAKSNSDFEDAVLTLGIPSDITFEDVRLAVGVAELTAEKLSANHVKVKLGAGDVRFEELNALSSIDVEGGAAEITVLGGTLNNLSFEIGIGELNMTAALLGDSELQFGVGESNLTIVGSKNDYSVEIEKGIGKIMVDGKPCSDFGVSGNGQNRIEIEGGIGTVHLNFQE